MRDPQGEAVLEEAFALLAEVEGLLEGLDYSLDWKERPEDPDLWSARDVASHLLGPPGLGLPDLVRRALEGGGDEVAVPVGDPCRTPERRALRRADLARLLREQVEEIARLLRSAGPADRARTVRLRLPDGSPVDLTPLDLVRYGLLRHWREHTERLREIRRALGVDF